MHHGHQKGVIHRDLKPSNILVDSSGQVKIIDFGVARSTDSDLAITTLQTDVGQLIGTLQYMSPEQCEADPHDIDVRSDVYALGVVFYELLAERLPYDISRRAIHEATRVIREDQPTKLSTLDRKLRGDVETIAFKALEKERDRRYQSATEFGQDIKRYLNDEPIVARRTSLIYQIRVFARRNRAAFVSIAAVFVILVAATVVSTREYLSAEDARVKAVAAAEEATRERDRAVVAEQLAEKRRNQIDMERKNAVEALGFMTNMLKSVSSSGKLGREATVEQLLDSVAGDIDKKFSNQDTTAATLHYTIGNTYYGLGRFETAESHLLKALDVRKKKFGQNHLRTAEVNASLGWIYFQTGRYKDSEEAHRAAFTTYKKLLGPGHNVTYESMIAMGDAASKRSKPRPDPEQQQLRQKTKAFIRKMKQRAERSNATSGVLNSYAWLLLTCTPEDLRDPEAALPVAKRSVEIGDKNNHYRYATSLDTLAQAYFMTGDFVNAVEFQEKVLLYIPKKNTTDRNALETKLARYRAALSEVQKNAAEQNQD